MLDIETLGTQSNSVIISIGAVRFNLETGETGEEFYKNIDIDTCLDMGLKVSGKTIQWWLSQSGSARDALKKDQGGLHSVLFHLSEFINEKDYVWGNSARFDLGLLSDAYNKINVNIPWDFRNELDVRTLVYLNPIIKKDIVKENKGVAHNAIDDCKLQIKYCSKIHKNLYK